MVTRKIETEGNGFVDASDVPFNQGLALHIQRVGDAEVLKFKAFLKTFQDVYTTEHNQQKVFGRNDPIMTFQGTQRVISLQFDIPSAGIEEAKTNQGKMSKLISFLYPEYDTGNATTISKTPLFKIKFANLISDATTASPSGLGDMSNALVGVIGGFAYNPDLEVGIFFDQDTQQLYPQNLQLNFEFTVLHKHSLDKKDLVNSAFPYMPGKNPQPQKKSAEINEEDVSTITTDQG
tara:strand:+ start:2050 stop:2754 length:705 start_codon:yes stop_codon:yes gene_type:complete